MPGEALGLVGESGCGKSTVALGGHAGPWQVNGRIVGGSIKFKGRDLNTRCHQEELRDIRGSEIAMIYQEPMASLNPAMKIGKQLMEVPMIHEGEARKKPTMRTGGCHDVKLPDPADPEKLSAPVVRRPAAAHRDRDGADVQTIPADPG